jgi:hypothetical protein
VVGVEAMADCCTVSATRALILTADLSLSFFLSFLFKVLLTVEEEEEEEEETCAPISQQSRLPPASRQ